MAPQTDLLSLLYISRSRLPQGAVDTIVSGIVDHAVAHNRVAGVTGALMFTGTHFAQTIEGEAAAIDALMLRITADSRHDQVIVVDRGPIESRRFPTWSMAYFGPSQFVARHVTRLLNDPTPDERKRAAGWLGDLMVEFAAS